MLNRLMALFDRRPNTAEDWLVRMSRPRVGAHDRAAFQAWLEQDDANLDQYASAKATMAGLEPLRGALEEELARLDRRLTRAAPRPGFRLAAGSALAAAIVAVFIAWPLLRPATPDWSLHQTGAGQIRDLTLEDGSTVTLDAASAIRVAVTGKVRRVELVRGAAYFNVAHNAARPFQVAVGDRRVIVTGTRFAASLREERAEVSVLQGSVAVGERDAGSARALDGALRLTPGDVATFQPGQAGAHKARADVDAATAWRDRRLVFRDAPLSDIVATAARYADRPLVIADPILARTRVTAVLPLEGADDLVSRMDRLLPITVQEGADGRAVIRAE